MPTDPVSPTLADLSQDRQAPPPAPGGEKTEIIVPPVPVIVSTPGKSSSEFLLALLMAAPSVLLTLCGAAMEVLPSLGTPEAGKWLIIVGVTSKVLIAMGYTASRASLKKVEAVANENVAIAQIHADSYRQEPRVTTG